MAKQADLIEGRGIKELDSAAEALRELRAERMKLLKQEVEAADALLSLMHKHQRETYSYNGYDVEVMPGKEKVKVRSQKDEGEEDGEE